MAANNNSSKIPGMPAPLTEEELAERRRKDIATLKASTQLLQEARSWADKSKMTDSEKSDYMKDVDRAIYENSVRAQGAGFSQEEIDNAKFSEPSALSIQRYNDYLKRKGKTHEEIARKDVASVISKVEESKDDKTRRRRRARINGIIGEEIQRVPNEDDIMNKTRIKREDENKQPVVLEVVDNKKEEVKDNVQPETSDKQTEKKEVDNTKNKKEIHKNSSPKPNKDGYVFSPDEVPVGVTWDTIPLPSKGECYPTKQSTLAVAELTANDENLIASPHMYRDGKILDILLKRKILDKSIDPEDLCKGDRDAIILWLRKSAYDKTYPVFVTNPATGKRYEVVANLDDFNYKEFNLKGDENGYFDYTTSDGDLIKFKFFTNKDEEEMKAIILEEIADVDVYNLVKYINSSRDVVKGLVNLNTDTRSELTDCLDDMLDIMKENNVTIGKREDDFVINSITEQMVKMIVSINGNDDDQFIRNYVNYMKAGESRKFRQFVSENQPGVDFSMTINIPESDGGGSFNTFLRLQDTIFLNV